MATTLEELQVLITAETKGLRKELDLVKTKLGTTHKEVAKVTSGISSAFKGIGAVVGLGLMIRKLTQFGQASVGLASNLSEVQNVVDVTFGSMSAEINAWSKNTLTQFGLSELSAKRYSSTLGAMMKSSGLAGSQMKEMSMRLTELSADMASFYNLSGDEAFDKIRSGLSGETEPLKRLGINMSVANLEAYALTQGIKKSYNAMSQAEQTLLRYNYLLSVTGDAQGDFARTSGSWANQVRLLSEQWKIFQSTVGQGLIAALTPVIQWLNAIIQRLQIAGQYFRAFMLAVTGASAGQKQAANAAAQAQLGVADAVKAVGDAAKGSVAGFDEINDISKQASLDTGGVSGLPGLAPELSVPEIDMGDEDTYLQKVKGIVDGIRSAWSAGIEGVKDLGGSLKEAFIAPIQGALGLIKPELAAFGASVAGSFGQISTLGEPVKQWFVSHLVPHWQTGIEASGVVLSGWMESIRMVFNDVFEAVFPILEWFVVDGLPLLTSFSDGGLLIMLSFWTGVKAVFDSLWSGAVQPGLELLSRVVLDILNIIRDRWYQFGSNLVNKVVESHERIKGLWLAFWDSFLHPIVKTIVETLTWLWDKHLKHLVDQLVVFVAKLVEGALDIYNEFILPITTWLVKLFGPTFASSFQLVIQVAGTLIAFVSDMAKSIVKILGGIIDFVVGVFTLNWKRAWQGVKDIFGGIWDGMVGGVKGALNLIIDAVNWAIRGMNRISIDVPKGVPIIGGIKWGLSIPEIPKLARGGIVDSATLALIGERGREAVVPLENTGFVTALANAVASAVGTTMLQVMKLGAAGSDPGGSEIALYLDGALFARAIIPAMDRERRRRGLRAVIKPT